MTQALVGAKQQEVRWWARKIALEDRFIMLNDQQNRDLELNAGLSDRINQEWDEDFGEVDSDSEVHEIREMAVVDCRS